MDDPTPDYMNLLGMIFSMCGLMLKVGGTGFPPASLRLTAKPVGAADSEPGGARARGRGLGLAGGGA